MLLCAGPAVSASDSGKTSDGVELKTVIATLEQGYRQLKDLQADFTQKTAIAALKRDDKGSGELLLKRPAGGTAMFRFDYRKPKQQIVSDGRQVWFYVEENKQVLVSDVKTMLAQGGVALNYITGLGNVSQDFSISFAGSGRDAKGNYQLDLVPKKSGQAFARLQLTIAADAVEKYRASGEAEVPFPVISSVIFDQMGNRTSIDYAKVKVNQNIPSARFTFKVPAGIEVIKP